MFLSSSFSPLLLLLLNEIGVLPCTAAAASHIRAFGKKELDAEPFASSSYGNREIFATGTSNYHDSPLNIHKSSTRNTGDEKVNHRILGRAGTEIIPLSIGDDFSRSFSEQDLLRGYKTNIADGESPFKQKVFEGDSYNSRFSTSYVDSRIIENAEDLRDAMEIGGSLSISYGPTISGKASGRYIEENLKTDLQTTILYRTRLMSYQKAVDVSTLKLPAGIDALGPADIAETYGTRFVEKIYYGAQLDVRYTFKSSDAESMFNITAELEGSIEAGPLSIEFEADFDLIKESTSSTISLEIEAKASGVEFQVKANPNITEMYNIIDEFNQKYDQLVENAKQRDIVDGHSNILNNFSPVAFSLGSIGDYTARLNVLETSILEERMTEMSNVFYSALFIKSQLLVTRDVQESIYTDVRDRAELYLPYKIFVDDEIAKLDHTLEKCLEYRRLPYSTVVGRGGSEAAMVPDEYPKDEKDIRVIDGLFGKAYIPPPVTVGTTIFDKIYYEGFAISSKDGSMVPWMEGALRYYSDQSIVATAMSPRELEKKGFSKVNGIDRLGFDYVRYGVPVHLESGSLWLIHESEGKEIATLNHLPANSGLWTIRSKDGNYTNPNHIDPKDKQCVEYGDTIYLQNNHTEKFINFGDDLKAKETSGNKWKVKDNIDYSEGKCVQMLSDVYLQNNDQFMIVKGEDHGHFLIGGRGETGGQVEIISGNDLLGTNRRWTFRQDDEKIESFSCGALSAHGKWQRPNPTLNIQTKTIQSVKFELGISGRENPPSFWQHTTSWEQSVVASVSGGFTIKGGEEEVDWFYGAILAESVEHAVKKKYEGDFIWPHDFAVMGSKPHDDAKYECIETSEGTEPNNIISNDIISNDIISNERYFCWNSRRNPSGQNPGFMWSEEVGQTENMKCTNINDNYLCVPLDSPLNFTWSSNGRMNDMSCIQWRADNYLCAKDTLPYIIASKDMPHGDVWQFVYEIEDICDNNWQLMTNELVVIANSSTGKEQPCCLPGFEADPDIPYGPCELSSPCFCDNSICEADSPFLPPQIEPWIPPERNETLPPNGGITSGSCPQKNICGSWMNVINSLIIVVVALLA